MTGIEASPMPSAVAGVELGGTKCICTLGYGPGRIVEQRAVETTQPHETLTALRAILDDWAGSHGFAALGIASFGPICLDPQSTEYGRILATTKPGWSGADVFGALTRGFAVPKGLDTDVNAAALAEVAWGSGKGLQDFAYVTVGTGIGVGLVVNGTTPRGILHGELGHMVVPRRPGDEFAGACTFHHNCVEGLASGTAIKQRLGALHVSTIAADHPVWDDVIAALAALCHNMICTTGPFRIAFGGGVINRQPHLVSRIDNALRESMAGYLTLPEAGPCVVPALLGDQAGPLGSLMLAMRAEAGARSAGIMVAAE